MAARAALVLVAAAVLLAGGTAVGGRAAPAAVRLPILLYHRVGPVEHSQPAVTRRLTVDPRAFAAQMEWLAAHRFHAVTEAQALAALEDGAALPPRPVLIGFDDGYRDVLWNAEPVLRRLGLQATAFVVTGRISGPDPSFLTWPELERLRSDGFDVESHTVTHRDLTALSDAELRAELVDSRRALEQHLGAPAVAIAYPYGRVDARVAAAARAAGYRLGMTTVPGAWQDAAAPLGLHRDEVLEGTSMAALLG